MTLKSTIFVCNILGFTSIGWTLGAPHLWTYLQTSALAENVQWRGITLFSQKIIIQAHNTRPKHASYQQKADVFCTAKF